MSPSSVLKVMRIPFVLALGLVLAVPAAARAQDVSPTPPAIDSMNREGLFQLEPGDVVRVKIWREKDLDGDYMVDERGDLTLPLLGTRHVVDRPWGQLRDSLLLAYRRELKAPSVSLVPLRRVYVLGEVTKPGLYLADPTLPLAGIVALAGGASPIGDLGRTRLLRRGMSAAQAVHVQDNATSVDVHSGDQIIVEQRSWFDRNSTFVASAAISIATILVTILKH